MKFHLTNKSEVSRQWREMEPRDECCVLELEIPIEIVPVDNSEENRVMVEALREMVLQEMPSNTAAGTKWMAKIALNCKPPHFDLTDTFVQFQVPGVIEALEKVATFQGLSLKITVDIASLYVRRKGTSACDQYDAKSKGLISEFTKNYGKAGGCLGKFTKVNREARIMACSVSSYESYVQNISVTCTAYIKPVVSLLSTLKLPKDFPKARLVLSPLPNVPENILDQEILTDAIIKTSDATSIKCHRSFLAAQSSVFRRMFENELQEAKTGVVEIPDLSGQGARALLRYLYFACVTKPTEKFEIAVELLKAGHKYDIEPLEKQMAVIILEKPEAWFDLETSISLFKFIRNLEGYENVKMKAVAFLKKNADELENSPQYTAMFEEDKPAAMELCRLSFRI